MFNEDKNSIVSSASVQGKKSKKRSVIIPAIVSLILSFALWFYVISVESPTYTKTYSLVPISISQGNGALSVYSSSGSTVDIVVSGKKSLLNQLTNDDFSVVADISGYKTAGKYNVPLSFSVPAGATKVSSSIDSLSLYLDSRTSVQVPVTVKLVDYTIDDGYEIGENAIEKSVEQVTVSGPGSLLSTIESARVTAALGHITSSKTLSAGFALVDAAGNEVTSPYISTDVTDVTVRIPVYLRREVPFTVVYKYGYFNSSNAKVTIRPSTVSVRGEVEAVNMLDSIAVATIDEKTMQDGKITTSVTAPDGITITDGTQTVEISVSLVGISTKTLAVDNITVKNPEGAVYLPAQDNIRVTLRGPSGMLDEITPDDVEVIVDASGNTSGQQNITQPAEIRISDGYSSSVYEVGEYSVALVKSDGE